ncbi:MAG: cobalamin biosynthesis protein [Pseudomonadota bacterium]
MSIALITLSQEGLLLAEIVSAKLPDHMVYAHESVDRSGSGPNTEIQPFDAVMDLTGRIFREFKGLVFFGPCGVAVRAVAPHVRHKLEDPAVVVVDVCGRYAVSLLSGHEGGANDLTLAVADALGAEPVISTTTEARKRFIVGVGCRKGALAETIRAAIISGLSDAGVSTEEVRLIASADIKKEEPGLIEAARTLRIPLRFVPSDEIRKSTREFRHSDFVESRVGLPAVAEPAALLAGRRTQLILPKRKYDGVTIAVAKESCSWSE